MDFRTSFIAAALVAGACSPSAAQESYDWSGFYAGVIGGVSGGSLLDESNPGATRQSLGGWTGGATVGANFQVDGGFVLGVELDGSLTDISAKWVGHDTNEYDSYYTSDKVTGLATARVRAGYALDRFLPYVTGGLAFASMDHMLGCNRVLVSEDSYGCRVAEFEKTGSATSFGYVVGVGAEMAVTDTISFKAEYLYAGFPSNKVTLDDPNYPDLGDRDFSTGVSTIRGGINFKF